LSTSIGDLFMVSERYSMFEIRTWTPMYESVHSFVKRTAASETASPPAR